ncbi:MAG: cation:proton antiporter, partial [Chloroflexota bacterium]|nr:cation:proton antiporter [Chloroflexota bacterium]
MEELGLLANMVIVLGVALIGGLLARRLNLPVILGYLLSGIVIGPNVLGLVRDVGDVETLAEIGVVLLMFTLGLEFSLKILRQIGRVAILGGICQIVITIALGLFVGWLMDLSIAESVVFGFFIALSSTIIVLKTLMDRGELGSAHGRVMFGILLVQDLSVVPMMVIIPSLGGTGTELLISLGWAILQAILFLGLILVLGFWVIPRVLKRVAWVRSRELFLLAVVSLCFGAALGAYAIGLSIAIGAFLAGLLVSESEYANQALADIRPLRDIFATLFFASLGMLADPRFVIEHPVEVLGVVVAIVLGKFVIVGIIPRLFGYSAKTSLFVGSGMFQIGEFSFILAALALEAQVISEELYSLTLTAAFITILMTPFSLSLASRFYYRMIGVSRFSRFLSAGTDPAVLEEGGKQLVNHAVVC